jgi:hypothetical protein
MGDKRKMNKEELIKLSRENLRKSKQGSLCECYDEAFIKGYELSKKRIAELEKENENLKKTYRKQRNKRIDDLQKENAELKGIKDVATLIRANNDTVVTLMQLNNKLVSKNQQLTNAKEIISEYINILKGDTKSWKKTQEKAEQFLNSEVEK